MRVVERAANLRLWLAVAALGVMGCVTVVDVAMKYLLNQPVTSAFDLVETLLPAVIFHGLPAPLLRRQNMSLTLSTMRPGCGASRCRWRLRTR